MEGNALPLDSPLWRDLVHAYGTAEDVPDLLRENAKSPNVKYEPNDEPSFSLWSALAHQGDVYTASYAAAEHIAMDAASRPSTLWFNRLMIIGWIEHCRLLGRGPDVPVFVAASYERACALTREKLLWVLANDKTLHPANDAPYLLDAIAALSGWTELSEYLAAYPDGPSA
jgi:hypothetical protein